MKQIKFFVIIWCIATSTAFIEWGDRLALFSTSNCKPGKEYLCENAKINEERMRAAYTKRRQKFNFCILNMKNNERIVIDTMLNVTIDRKLNLNGQCISKQTSTATELKVSEGFLIVVNVSFELTRIIASMLLTMDIILVAITEQPMYPTPLLDKTTFFFIFEANLEVEFKIMNFMNNYNITYVGFLYLKEFDEDKQNFEKPCSDRKKSAFCLFANLDVKRQENCYKEILVDYRDPVSINNTMELILQDPNLRFIFLHGSVFSVHEFTSNPIVLFYEKERILKDRFVRPLTRQKQLLPWLNLKKEIEAKPFCNLKMPTCLPGQELTHGFYRDTHWQNSYGWNCQLCPLKTFKDVKGNSKCEFCRYPRITNIERTQCYDPYENLYLRIDEYIIVVIISLASIVLMLIVVALFWKYRATPIVKYANRPITVLQLASHLALAVTSLYLFFGMPTRLKCTFRPLTVGIFFTLTVSINLGKTEKLLIIFNSKNRHTENERRFISVLEWLITASLVIVDVAIFIISIVDHPPEVKDILNEDAGEYIRDITCSNNVHILIQLSFILILILANGVQALRSRNLPSYFKETTHVIYSSFTSVIFLSVAVAIYAAQGQSHIRDIILYTCVMLLNLIHFLLMYTYKVYIILFKAELNTVAAFNAKRQKKLQKQFHQS